jgi:CRP-like cAMP-binding protein
MDSSADGVELLRIGLRQVGLYEFVQQDELLWRAPLLAALDAAERERLLTAGRVRGVASGEVLLAEDAVADALYFLLEGSVVLAADGGSIDLATLTKGDFFGLSAVIRDAVRPAVQAPEGGARLALLPAADLTRLARSHPALGRLLARTAEERHTRYAECQSFMDLW